MAQASKNHCLDIGPKGLMTHEGSSETNNRAKHRLRKCGQLIGHYGENLSFGCASPTEVLCWLIIDDGSKSKSHRNNVFSEQWNFMGCYSGNHKDFMSMSCIDYAEGYIDKGEKDPLEEQIDDLMKEEVVFKNMPIKGV